MNYPYKVGVYAGIRTAAEALGTRMGCQQKLRFGSSLCSYQLLCTIKLHFERLISWLAGFAFATFQCVIVSITYTRAFSSTNSPSSYVPEELIRWLLYLEDLSAAQGAPHPFLFSAVRKNTL